MRSTHVAPEFQHIEDSLLAESHVYGTDRRRQNEGESFVNE